MKAIILWFSLFLVFVFPAVMVAADGGRAPELRLPRLPASAQARDEVSSQGKPKSGHALQETRDPLVVGPVSWWTEQLWESSAKPIFVSFACSASVETMFEVGAVRLGVVDGDMPGRAEVMFMDREERWQSLGVHVPLQKYHGRSLAVLPILTVRIDPRSQSYDIYLGMRLIRDDLPLAEAKNQRRIAILGGEHGALVSGLTQSAEHPLYEDSNDNGVDDDFERQKLGRLQAAGAIKGAQSDLMKQWREAQRKSPPPALFHQRPRPDPS